MLKFLLNTLFCGSNPTNNDPFFDKIEEKEEKPVSTPVGVSEPVLSFVKLLREEPENFLWERERKGYGFDVYKLIDKKNRKVYKYRVDHTYIVPSHEVSTYEVCSVDGIFFLTRQELHYLSSEHRFALEREAEREEYERKERVAKQRQDYINIYCKK